MNSAALHFVYYPFHRDAIQFFEVLINHQKITQRQTHTKLDDNFNSS